jgi:hypothetical protein
MAYDASRPTLVEYAGHSTVYHPASRSIYVYGGVVPGGTTYSYISSSSYLYSVDLHAWTQVRLGPPITNPTLSSLC